MLNKTIKLLNDMDIPIVGFGTWLIENEHVSQAVQNAIECGYRHIDTAQNYKNEEGVGEGIRLSKINRQDLFITTKVRARHKDYETALKSIDESLNKLQLDIVDLILIHDVKVWEERDKDYRYEKENREVWRALEKAYQDKQVKAIGVSNFEIVDLKNIIDHATIKPMVNQIKVHIGNTPFELIEYCQKNGIVVEAYSPIGHGDLLKNESLIEMAKKYDVSVAQLAIRYTLQLGCVTLPKASSKEHIQNNAQLNFVISDEDMNDLKQFKLEN